MNRLKLAEKDKDSLEGARAEADQFLRLDATIRKKQNVLYQAHLATAAENVEQVIFSTLDIVGVPSRVRVR